MKSYCLNRLNAIEYMLKTVEFVPAQKLRLITKQNILKHLIEFKTYNNFANQEELERYIEDSTDIVCGFYED
jgi:hypothetical protein